MTEKIDLASQGSDISRRAFVGRSAAVAAGLGLGAEPAFAGERPASQAQGRTWRVGILGLGHWYSAYGLARALPEYPRAELVACAWHEQPQLEEFTRTFGIDAHRTYAELLARRDIDIVHICPPVSEIPEATIAAARAGKHIIMGKPMAMTRQQADAMVAAVEASGVVCVPFTAGGRLGSAGLKARIDAGEIGELSVIHQTARWSIAEDWLRSGKPGWFADPRHVPGGSLIDEGIYGLENFLYLAGADPVEVSARTANYVHKDIAVEDWGMATYRFPSGLIATLEGAWTINSPQKSGPSPKQNAVVRTELVGTRGEIMTQMSRDPGFAILAAGARNWTFERTAGEQYVAGVPQPLDHLIQCIEQRRAPVSTIRDARKALIMGLTAYESARNGGRPVQIQF